MDIVSSLKAYNAAVSQLLQFYRDSGRPILDFMHIIFQNIFDILLIFAIVISVLYFLMSVYILFSRGKNKSAEIVLDDNNAPFVTVQIPTMNEIVAIRCAKKCLEFDYPQGRYEILIGDDSKDTAVSKKLDDFAKEHSLVKLIRRGHNAGYKAGNLNNMLKYSNGDVLVLFDSDFIPKPDFLRRIVAPFIHDKELSAVQARWKFINPNQNLISVLGATIVTVFHHITLPFINKRKGFSFLCGSAEAVRKSTLVTLGGWKEGSLTEDIEYSLRLLKNRHKILYLDDLECESELPYKPKDLYRQQMRWAYGVTDSFKIHQKDIAKSSTLKFSDKIFINLIYSGYLLAILLACLFIVGFFSFITDTPGPIDFVKFFSELGINILLTSGLIIASIIAFVKSKNLKGIIPMMASSVSYGLVGTYYVNKGIIKALAKRPMEWYLLNKKGNEFVS